ncbi:MAG: DUF1836 domain-containing protein [Lachnospiraceae bacterium]|nr:DUF1836 domain-containing protein [Lachnospiraceae bacterium]
MMDVNKILENLINNMSLISPDDIPNISLYMDQVTTFMDNHLYSVKRFEDDKALTKTMINNYAKNDLLPSPEKKKYTKDHVLLLTFIYYFKSVLSISDIKKLLQPISDKFFLTNKGANLEDIYNEVESYMSSISESVLADVKSKSDAANQSFSDEIFKSLPTKDSDYLKLFKLISMLCFDIYLKKQLIESIVDTLEEPLSKAEKEKLAKKEMEAREKRLKKEREEREKFKK